MANHTFLEEDAADLILKKTGGRIPEVALILGSGLGDMSDLLQGSTHLPYGQLPGFPVTTVEGHSGELHVGTLDKKFVLILKGRFHYYEGKSMQQITYPVRVIQTLGIEKIIITSASGAADPKLERGDIMIVKDHINFTFDNPFIGSLGKRFVDTSSVYDKKFIDLATRVAEENGIGVRKGVYFYFTGPSYETPAEVRMAYEAGSQVVGMSTFPEAVEAHSKGLRVLGITYVANMAAGLSEIPLHHEDVMETMKMIKTKFQQLLRGIVREL